MVKHLFFIKTRIFSIRTCGNLFKSSGNELTINEGISLSAMSRLNLPYLSDLSQKSMHITAYAILFPFRSMFSSSWAAWGLPLSCIKTNELLMSATWIWKWDLNNLFVKLTLILYNIQFHTSTDADCDAYHISSSIVLWSFLCQCEFLFPYIAQNVLCPSPDLIEIRQ